VLLELWDTQHYWVIAEFGDEHGDSLMVFMNAEVCFGEASNIS
jgi:cephalosporin hydroxylase